MEEKVKNNNMFVKIIFILIIISLLVVIIFFTFVPVKEKTLKIGVLLTLSGAGMSMGEDLREGLFFAGNEINSMGGINGRKIEFIIEDSKSDPNEAKKMFLQIEEEHHPVLYISNMSSVGLALASLAEENEVPLIGLITSTQRLTTQKKWVFRYWSSAEIEANTIISIVQKLDIENTGILSINDEYGLSINRIITEGLTNSGTMYTKKEFNPDESNLKKQLEDMMDMDSIIIIGYPPHIRSITQQIEETGYTGKIILTNAASHPALHSISGLDGSYIPAPLIYKKDFIFAKTESEEFKEIYQRDFNHFSANSYDFINILSSIMAGKEISRINVKNQLEKGFIYNGIYGDVRVKKGEHDISFNYFPAIIIDGSIEFLE